MMQYALNAITSLFIPCKTIQPAKKDSPENPHQVLPALTSSDTDMTDINRELNTYNNRLALDLTNFMKQLETHRVGLKLNVQNII